MRRSIPLSCLALALASVPSQAGDVEIIRDRWGTPHVFAALEADGFFGLGFACAEDRLLQMELFRRRAAGRLAEVLGVDSLASDRRFRTAGVAAYCAEAFANLPADLQANLRAYAAGVNAFVQADPARARKRLAPLGIASEPWIPSDAIACWIAVTEVFDGWFAEPAPPAGPIVIDDAAAVVPESEMAKDRAVYERLNRIPRSDPRRVPAADPPIRFSHAWAVDGTRSTTGKPILESDPQVAVSNPPLWYEFHLAAGRYDVRGIGVAGCPALLIGWNRRIAWGASALGAGSNVTYIEKLSEDGRGYLHEGEVVPFDSWRLPIGAEAEQAPSLVPVTAPFDRRIERIDVKGGESVLHEVLTTRRGFVFNPFARTVRPGEALVSHVPRVHDRTTAVAAMLAWMRASDWSSFREAMALYDAPGLHIVYADASGSIGYQTLVRAPSGSGGRIPLDDLPHMLNPDAHFISHANNLPVGSWYPLQIGIGTGGIGDTSRSMRLRQILSGDAKLSVDDFESKIHRDDVHAAVAALLPVARKVAEEDGIADPGVTRILEALRSWDFRYRASEPEYTPARALSATCVMAIRGSPIGQRLGGGEAGVCHIARILAARFAQDGTTPKDPDVRAYLARWLRLAAAARPGPEIHRMPYQACGPLQFPSLDPRLDMESPPLSCGEIGTIWSQPGNSYTQIVDLADVDRSRSILPPGVSEDPESPFHADQIPLWVKGTTHPAPLSREKVEAIAATRTKIAAIPYGETAIETFPARAGDGAISIDLSALPRAARILHASLICSRDALDGRDDRALIDIDIRPPGGEPLSLEGPWFRSFDATEIVRRWVANPETNQGLRVAAFPGWKPELTSLEITFEGGSAPRPPQVTGIRAIHRAGQTFITWRESDDRRVRYRIYRSSDRIDGATVARATLLGEVGADSSLNVRGRSVDVLIARLRRRAMDDDDLAKEIARTDLFERLGPESPEMAEVPIERFAIEDGKPLPDGTGLYVHCTEAAGRAYYAVIASAGGTANARDFSEANSLAEPVDETAGAGEPVLQGEAAVTVFYDYPGTRYRYVQWAAPPNAPLPNQYYNLGVFVPRGYSASPVKRLGVFFHDETERYLKPPWPHRRDTILISPHDSPFRSYGYGHHEALGTLRSFRQGRVRPFLARRVDALIDWGIRRFGADPGRVSCGASGYWGGTAALQYGLRRGGRIAVVCVDAQADSDPRRTPDQYVLYIWRSDDPPRPTPRPAIDAVWGKPAWGVPAESGKSIWEEANLAAFVRASQEPLPFLSLGAGSMHVAWPQEADLMRAYLETRNSFMAEFFWGSSEHLAIPVATEAGERPFEPRADRPLLACRPKGVDPNPEFYEKHIASGARGYSGGSRLNTRPRWDPEDIEDSKDRLAMTIYCAAHVVYAGREIVETAVRNACAFRPAAGEALRWRVTEIAGGKERQAGTIAVEEGGIIVIPDLEFSEPARLVIERASAAGASRRAEPDVRRATSCAARRTS